MFAELFDGTFTVPQIAIFLATVIIIILSLVIILNCYRGSCCRGESHLRKCEKGDQRFFDKEYYEKLCTLLYRHNQMEMKQMEGDWELKRKNETEQRANSLHERRKSNSEAILLLKDDLKTFKIDHNIEIKNKAIAIDEILNKRRTWIGIEDDGRFESLRMPTTDVTQKIEMTNASDRCASTEELCGQETTV